MAFSPTRLRSWMKKYGNWGVLIVALYFGVQSLWIKPRRALAAGIALLTFAVVCSLTPGSQVHSHPGRGTHPALPGAEANLTNPVALARWKELARQIREEPLGEQPDAKMGEALEILLLAALDQCKHNPRITDEQIIHRLDAFAQVIAPDRNGCFGDEACWFDIQTAHMASLCAITATYGPVSRLAVFDMVRGERLRVPAETQWLYPWRASPCFTADNTLLLLSDRVQAAGMREGLRIDSLHLRQGAYQPVQTLFRERVLDMDGPLVHENRLTVFSVDEMNSLYT